MTARQFNTNHEDGIPSIFSPHLLAAEASNRQTNGAHFPHLLDAPSFEFPGPLCNPHQTWLFLMVYFHLWKQIPAVKMLQCSRSSSAGCRATNVRSKQDKTRQPLVTSSNLTRLVFLIQFSNTPPLCCRRAPTACCFRALIWYKFASIV